MESCTTEQQYESVLVSYNRYVTAHPGYSYPAAPAYHQAASAGGCAAGAASSGVTYVTVPATQTVQSAPVTQTITTAAPAGGCAGGSASAGTTYVTVPASQTVQYAPVQTQYVQGGQAAAVGGCGH